MYITLHQQILNANNIKDSTWLGFVISFEMELFYFISRQLRMLCIPLLELGIFNLAVIFYTLSL